MWKSSGCSRRSKVSGLTSQLFKIGFFFIGFVLVVVVVVFPTAIKIINDILAVLDDLIGWLKMGRPSNQGKGSGLTRIDVPFLAKLTSSIQKNERDARRTFFLINIDSS